MIYFLLRERGGIIFFSEPEKNYFTPPLSEGKRKQNDLFLFYSQNQPLRDFFLLTHKRYRPWFFSPTLPAPFFFPARKIFLSLRKKTLFYRRKKIILLTPWPGKAILHYKWFFPGGENFEKTFARKNEFFFLGKKLFFFDRGGLKRVFLAQKTLRFLFPGGGQIFFSSSKKFILSRQSKMIFFYSGEVNHFFLKAWKKNISLFKETKWDFFSSRGIVFSQNQSPRFFLVDRKQKNVSPNHSSPRAREKKFRFSSSRRRIFLSLKKRFILPRELKIPPTPGGGLEMIFFRGKRNLSFCSEREKNYFTSPIGRAKKFFITNDFSFGRRGGGKTLFFVSEQKV